MGLSINYDAVRSEIIAKLLSQGEDMEDILNKLDASVDSLPSVMEAKTLDAYINEYHVIVQRMYQKLNENLGIFAQQLEDACKDFEELDSELNNVLDVSNV